MRNLTLLVLTGCFRVTNRPICEEVSAAEVSDDEQTPAGTVDELMEWLAIDTEVGGHWQDDTEVTATVKMHRGTRPAQWVELREATEQTRSLGFGGGTLLIGLSCTDHLRIPVEASVRAPADDLVVTVEDSIGYPGPNTLEDSELHLSLSGRFSDATFPPGDTAPNDFTNKYSFVQLNYDEAGLVYGGAGWGGEQETEDYKRSIAEYVVQFGAVN